MSVQRLRKFASKLWQIIQEDLMHVNIGVESAAMTYYILLSIIPITMLVANLIPLLPIPVDTIFKTMQTILPENINRVLLPILKNYLGTFNGGAFSIGLLILFWPASQMFSSLQRSLNLLYGAPVRRNVIFERFFAIIIAMVAILIVFVVSFVFIFGEQLLHLISDFFSINLSSVIIDLSLVKWGLLMGTVFLLMSFMYFAIPNVKRNFLYALPGGLFTTTGFVLISQLFSIYIHFAGRNFTANGAFGTLIVFMIWLYFIANVMILGGVLNVIIYRFRHPKESDEGEFDEKEELNVR